MKNIHNKIYLQVGDEITDDIDFEDIDTSEVYWSDIRQFPNDIEYTRSESLWISVEDRLPELGTNIFRSEWVLGSDGQDVFTSLLYWNGEAWHDCYSSQPETRITHWQPLPPVNTKK